MPKDTKSSGNNKAPACESRGFGHKKEGENFDTPSSFFEKQCIKSPQTRQINSSTSPSRFHEDPGLHLFHTRISHTLPPGSEETFQVVFGKRTACLHEKTSLFNLFCISFRRYLEFDRRLTYNALLFLTMMVMIDE